MVVGKVTAAQCNFNHLNQIWKDYVHKEIEVSKKWEGTWGFLRDEYRTLNRNMSTVKHKRRRQSPAPLKLPTLQAPKQDTSNPFPQLASNMIGWRSGRRNCNLEVYGRWGRPKNSIVKQLKWPNDAVP